MIAFAVWMGCCLISAFLLVAADKIVDAIKELKGDE